LGKPYTALYAKNTILGDWLRQKNVLVKIGNLLFVHGGITSDLTDMSTNIDSLNNMARRYVDMPLNTIANNPKAKAIFDTKNGPLWYRGHVQLTQGKEELMTALSALDVDKVVVGHTSVDSIKMMYNDHIIAIDVPHNRSEFYQRALLIEGDRVYDINSMGDRKLLKINIEKEEENI